MSRANGKKAGRRHFTPEDKARILRRHLVEKVAISDLCDEYRIPPTRFYLWQRQAFEQLSAALQNGRTRHREAQAGAADRARVVALEARLAKKDAVIAEVSEEYLALKRMFFTDFRDSRLTESKGRAMLRAKRTNGGARWRTRRSPPCWAAGRGS